MEKVGQWNVQLLFAQTVRFVWLFCQVAQQDQVPLRIGTEYGIRAIVGRGVDVGRKQ